MARKLDRQKALDLRAQGKSYSQIKSELGISKSTLSEWLRGLPLNKEQLRQLRDWNQVRIEKFRHTMADKRKSRLSNVYGQQKQALLPLTEKELFIAGIFLYWGEGAKQHGQVSISNSNPRIIKFALFWLVNILKVPLTKIKLELHLYEDMDIAKELLYWSKILSIPVHQFNKPYIKKSTRQGLTYKSFGHGTCRIVYPSVSISEQIAMSIKVISDKYGEKDDIFWYN